MRIAMWSGPRNLSTAMMYSFAARGDCAVWDEPFYAPYLANTALDHPVAAEIISAHEDNPDTVARACVGPIPGGKAHFYQKHMAHHMLPDFPMQWCAEVTHVHLIRHPARVIASYDAKRENPTLSDIGVQQQLVLADKLGGLVIDSADIRAHPEQALIALCEAIGLPFTSAMLHWAPGGVPEDGVWAKHWYGAVHRSTGFAGPEGPLPDLDGELQPLLAQAMPFYRALETRKLATV